MKGRMFVYTLVIILLAPVIFLQSCTTRKKLNTIIYFNDKGDTALSKVIQNSEPLIQTGDKLSIVVNALDMASAAPYNLGSGISSSQEPGATRSNGGYIVEADSTIHFPQFGNIRVGGMQRKQLIDTLTNRLTKYVRDPIVTIQFLNFKITILGEVTKPGVLDIAEGKVTLTEALGRAGDLPITARRDSILVIREKNGQREFGYVNILSRNAFSSPYYNLKQNDIVYVELTKEKVIATDVSLTKIRNNISLAATALALISTIAFLIVNFKK